MKTLLIVSFLFVGLESQAGYFQAPVNTVKISNIEVRLESGNTSRLDQLLEASNFKGKSTFIIPAYFDCSSTCPLFAENLRDAFKDSQSGTDGEVLFVSFNPEDTSSSMERFRKHHKLPSQWVLAIIKNESQARDFLDQFNYQFQKTHDGYDHPNSGFVLSKVNHLWTGMLVGTDNSGNDVDRAIGEANYSELSGTTHAVVRILKQPEYLIAIGFVGVVLPLLIIILMISRRRKFVGQEQTA